VIRRKQVAISAATLLALLSASCGKARKARVQESDSRSSATAGLRTPAALTVQPSAPPAGTPPARPADGFAPVFAGEVSRGQRFEKGVLPGMVFRLEPYVGDDLGWDIRLVPDTEPSPASIDCIGAISKPTHGSNALAIELPQDKAAPGDTLRAPHEFDFVPDASDCKRAWDLNNTLNYQYNLTAQQREELDRKLSEIPTAHGRLQVLEFRLGAAPAAGQPGAIEWIKFEVALQFQPTANPARAKAKVQGGGSQNLPAQAGQEIPYSLPSAFGNLPIKIKYELESRGCRIPQTYEGSAPQNVIHGQFAKRGQTDWAILCSRLGASSILVFWGGSEAAPAEIRSAPDSIFFTPIENGKIGFARAISSVGKDFIVDHFKAYGGPQPPPVDHDGINDEVVEKGSTVHYFYRGQWLELTGSD